MFPETHDQLPDIDPLETAEWLESFDSVVQAKSPDMLSIVAAFDEAIGKVMKRLVTWTLKQGQQHTTS